MTRNLSVKSKLSHTPTTIFTKMSALATEHSAINLSQGFPDFNCSPKLIELVHHYMKRGDNQYAPMQGIIQLRERIAEKTQTLYNRAYDPVKEITITAGGTQAIYVAFMPFLSARWFIAFLPQTFFIASPDILRRWRVTGFALSSLAQKLILCKQLFYDCFKQGYLCL